MTQIQIKIRNCSLPAWQRGPGAAGTLAWNGRSIWRWNNNPAYFAGVEIYFFASGVAWHTGAWDSITILQYHSLCVIAQGSKEVHLGERRYQYDPYLYLLVTAELPLVGQILEAPVLAPLITREIVYRLLMGEQGDRLRHIAVLDGESHRIAQALKRLHEEFDQTIQVESLADELGMSTSVSTITSKPSPR
jgi:hypothetical protein